MKNWNWSAVANVAFDIAWPVMVALAVVAVVVIVGGY